MAYLSKQYGPQVRRLPRAALRRHPLPTPNTSDRGRARRSCKRQRSSPQRPRRFPTPTRSPQIPQTYPTQVLLQLNIAYYLPSIPTLMIMGTLEPLLEAELGQMGSISARLAASLLACAATCAAWPFLPGRLVYVLW